MSGLNVVMWLINGDDVPIMVWNVQSFMDSGVSMYCNLTGTDIDSLPMAYTPFLEDTLDDDSKSQPMTDVVAASSKTKKPPKP